MDSNGIKIVNAKDMTDEQWQLYAQMENDLRNKYYKYDPQSEVKWQDLKKEMYKDLELLKEDLLTYKLFIVNEKAVSWLGIRLNGEDAEFALEAAYDVLPEFILKQVFQFADAFMTGNNKNEIKTYSRRKSIVDSFTEAGGNIYDKRVFARLMKEDMDIEKLRRTAEETINGKSYKLALYDTIHEEIIDRYLDVYNDARVDMNLNNPIDPVIVQRTKQDVYKKLKWDKGPDDKMFLYILFDKENIAAFCSLFIRDHSKHMVDQAGGLTTVARNYRGQGLAKYLKAKMYIKMLEEYPDFEYIRTDTYPWNKYMYSINEEMGFKSFEEYFEIIFTSDKIKKYLNKFI